MDYVIKNGKEVYIRLNSNGNPVTCTKKDMTLFEFSKAKNILRCLPKNLKKLHFRLEAVPDFSTKSEKDDFAKGTKIQKENYVVPTTVSRWVDKFGICEDVLKEARERKEESYQELSNLDKQFNNLIHEIELEGKVDLYGGWVERNRIKENREKRRVIKDELLIISHVLKMDFRNIDKDTINKAVEGLANRIFTYRIVEEEETDAV